MKHFSIVVCVVVEAALTLAACAHTSLPAAPPPSTTIAPTAPMAAPPPPPPLPAEGHISDEAAQRVVNGGGPRARQCYESALQRDPTLEGSVELRATVDRDGVVTGVEDAGSTLPDAEVVRCVLEVVKTFRFPAPGGEKAVVPGSFHFGVTGEKKGEAHGCRVSESEEEGKPVSIVACKSRILTVHDSAREVTAEAARAHFDAIAESLPAGATTKRGTPVVAGKRSWDFETVEDGRWSRSLLTPVAPGRTRSVVCMELASAKPSAWCRAMAEALVGGKSPFEALQAVGP